MYMPDLNNVCLIGRITKDAEIQYTAKGIPIYCFSIANNLTKKVNNEWVTVPNFFNFRLLGKRWEGISAWLTKGRLVSVQGQAEQEKWEQDGVKRSCLKISIREIQPLWADHHHTQKTDGEGYTPEDETACGTETETIPEAALEEAEQ
jgi:single-strand DNA-binding protein